MENILKGSFALMKQLNVSFILECIKRKGPISRAKIAEITELTPASISKITNELMERGFIQEAGLGESSGGRPPILLSLNPKAGYIIGVNLGPGILEAIITDLEANIVIKVSEELKNLEQKHILEELFNLINEVIFESKVDKEEIIGIGMAVHGLVNSKTGLSIFAPHYHWEDITIKKMVEEEFEIPTFIDNDVRAMAIGESWFGIAQDINNFIIINISNGIGSGIVIDGKPYHGVDYSAGEVGHIVIDSNDGPKCSCGNYGCLESLASNPVIVDQTKKLIKQGAKSKIVDLVDGNLEKITAQIVSQAAKDGDELARDILKEIGRYLGIGIADLLNILNPGMVVIVGDIIKAKEHIFKPIKEAVKVKALDLPVQNVNILPTGLGENTATIGAVTLVLKELFKGTKLLD